MGELCYVTEIIREARSNFVHKLDCYLSIDMYDLMSPSESDVLYM